VDIWWGLGIASAAVIGWFAAEGAHDRRLLITVLVLLWGLRLGLHIAVRNWGHEDPRYARLRQHVESQGQSYALHSLLHVNLYQGFFMWIQLAPIVITQVAREPVALGWLAYAGTGLWCVGMFFETVADWQLTRFKADPSSAARVLDTGLWRYSRHPNYFGEACIWWGYWLIACEVPWGWATVFAPAAITRMILGMMGKELVERRMLKKRPGYQAYVERTSGFFPLPPRRSS
jgi:steroid 5-alpha reductase family enzyme